MGTIRQNLNKLSAAQKHKTDLVARGVSPVVGTSGGVAADGRVQVIVDGRDCSQPSDIRSAAPGDKLIVEDNSSRDGIAQAPGAVILASGAGLRPEIIAADPSLWVGAGLVVSLTGRYLTDITALELRLPHPLSAEPFPGITIDGFTVLSDTEIELTVTVGSVPSPSLELIGGVAYDEQTVVGPRYIAPELFTALTLPLITAIVPPVFWNPDFVPFLMTATGLALDTIDTIDFRRADKTPPFDGGIVVATVVGHPDSETLELSLLPDDQFDEVWVPSDVVYGEGLLDLQSDGLWQILRPDNPFVIFEAKGPSETGPTPIGDAGFYSNFGDPAVLPAGRVVELPSALPSTYSSPHTGFYNGRPDFQHYASDPSGEIIGPIVVIAERGDALPDGGAGTAQAFGLGSNVWISILDVDGDVMHTVLIPGENRLLGPWVDGNGLIWAVVYTSGSGAQLISTSTLAENALGDPGFDAVGPRTPGPRVPHEMICGTPTHILTTEWDLGADAPSAFTHAYPTAGGVRTYGSLTTPLTLLEEWGSNARAGVVRGSFGGWRMGNEKGSANTDDGLMRPVLVSVFGSNVTETDGWPNIPFGLGGIREYYNASAARSGTFTSAPITGGGHFHCHLVKAPNGRSGCVDLAASTGVADPNLIPSDYEISDYNDVVPYSSSGGGEIPRGSFPPGTF